jgi:hypothetical protein
LIAYSLICAGGHTFEGWFASGATYDVQAAAGTLTCPMCGERRVAKGVMAPAVKTSITKKKGRSDSVPAQAPQSARAHPDPQKMQQFMAGFRKYVQENADYVGPRFPEEARKIHYGETQERQIYGEATPREAREMVEEGIDIAPLPPDPNDLN